MFDDNVQADIPFMSLYLCINNKSFVDEGRPKEWLSMSMSLSVLMPVLFLSIFALLLPSSFNLRFPSRQPNRGFLSHKSFIEAVKGKRTAGPSELFRPIWEERWVIRWGILMKNGQESSIIPCLFIKLFDLTNLVYHNRLKNTVPYKNTYLVCSSVP